LRRLQGHGESHTGNRVYRKQDTFSVGKSDPAFSSLHFRPSCGILASPFAVAGGASR
jgi:hypothetical protein